jgi:DNA-binding beta-propeller fold protein YncE
MRAIAATLLVLLTGAAPAKVAVGQWTYGLAASGGSVWVGGLELGDVYRVDPSTGKVTARVTVGPRVFNLASAPGAVWVVSQAVDTVSRIDTRTGKRTLRISTGSSPYDVAWGFGSAWVANAGDGTVWRITNGRVVKRITVGVEPNGLAAYGGSLWVSDHTAGKVVRIDPATNRITGAVRLPGADWVTGYRGSLYVSQETNVVTRVDARTLRVTGSVRVARNPLGSAIVGGVLWVPCIDASAIDVVDPATMKVVARKPGGPSPIVVLRAYGHTWVSHTAANYVSRY